ncbi:MAG: hypothetical protein R3200_04395 [Xanthomonadales bacterium]|nr:hypothetical protein [Xanthomonadales bacterium]
MSREKAFDYHQHLAYHKRESLTFAQFVEECTRDPENALLISSQLISEAIKFFGFKIVVRSGEPVISYNIFEDPFCDGVNAIFGQEFCIKQLVDVIEQVGKESGPNRGIVLVGPPASGKTNIIDLVSLALEEYTKQAEVRLYSFYFHFQDDAGRVLEIRSPFLRNPMLLFPTILQHGERIDRPREAFFSHLRGIHGPGLRIPNYYRDAALDKRSMEILQALLDNPRNRGKSLSDVIDEYVRVEEIEFSNGQARGIANTDDLNELRVRVRPMELGHEYWSLLSEHLPGFPLTAYEGALVAANRGLLHIHDAFAMGAERGPSQESYKPLLMLLGSGRASVEATQTSIDTTAVITTNVEELGALERQLTSTKLMDRIEKIPVNYLLDANSEQDILARDLANIQNRYEIDPNLLRIAAYYSVLTRLLPPSARKVPPRWSDEKKALLEAITPEQKLFIYATQSEDPVRTIEKLPFWHPFRSLAFKLGIDLSDPDSYRDLIDVRADRLSLESSGMFSNDQLALIDDEFMRVLAREHYPLEGQFGISVRQLQNIMRNTIAASDGRKVHVGTFMSQLRRVFDEGKSVHHWLSATDPYAHPEPIPARTIGTMELKEGQGDYGDFKGLSEVLRGLYYQIIRREITQATVDRDPADIEADLRRYLQHALLYRAVQNQAFAHVMVPRFSFIDPRTGNKVDEPSESLLEALESVLAARGDRLTFRNEMAQRFLRLQENGELRIEPDKSIVASRDDNLLECFRSEYQVLLSHRRTVHGLDPGALAKAFVDKANNEKERFLKAPEEARAMVDKVLLNMKSRFGYPYQIALDTIVFAIRKEIVDFAKILR